MFGALVVKRVQAILFFPHEKRYKGFHTRDVDAI